MMHSTKPMMGLKNAAPESMEQEDEQPSSAASILEQAITLHEGHMSGKVPTSDESQQQLMDLLNQALDMLEQEDE